MVASAGADMVKPIYHERQVKELCALHALNNLFQERGFSKQELDQICYSLSPDVWINPHKSLLGIGNYDINVIMAALQRKGCEAVWFDKRRDPTCLCLDNIKGFILNVPMEYKIGFVLLPLRRRHWIALRKIQDVFYNLDSKLHSPQLIGKDSDLLQYLKNQMDNKEKELFLVVSKEVDINHGWLNNTTEKKDNNADRDSIRYIEEGYQPEVTDVNATEIEENLNEYKNTKEDLENNKNLR
ncbi:josephin-2-like [Prorops nasuta]|uniref:josephin-2-like n=1 Tax=Prorops nasuta TaxID=863751 RepID=UPI0034CFAB73